MCREAAGVVAAAAAAAGAAVRTAAAIRAEFEPPLCRLPATSLD
jgi:hypothetical protein